MTYPIPSYYHTINDMLEFHGLNDVEALRRFVVEYEPNQQELVHGLIGYLKIVSPGTVRALHNLDKLWCVYNSPASFEEKWELHLRDNREIELDYGRKLFRCIICHDWMEVSIDKVAQLYPRHAVRLPDYAIGPAYVDLYEETGMQLHRAIPYQIWVHIYIWLLKNHCDRVSKY